MGRVGVRVRGRVRIGSKVAFWAVFDVFLLIILEAHTGQTNVSDFHVYLRQ